MISLWEIRMIPASTSMGSERPEAGALEAPLPAEALILPTGRKAICVFMQ
jgi:hypothetical protein